MNNFRGIGEPSNGEHSALGKWRMEISSPAWMAWVAAGRGGCWCEGARRGREARRRTRGKARMCPGGGCESARWTEARDGDKGHTHTLRGVGGMGDGGTRTWNARTSLMVLSRAIRSLPALRPLNVLLALYLSLFLGLSPPCIQNTSILHRIRVS